MTGSLVTSWEKLVSPSWHDPLGTSPGWGQPHFSPWNSIFCGFSGTVHSFPGSKLLPQFPLLPLNTQDQPKCLLSQISKQNSFLCLLSPPVWASGVSKMFSIATPLKNHSQMGMASDSLWTRDGYWEQTVRGLNSILMNWKYGHWI